MTKEAGTTSLLNCQTGKNIALLANVQRSMDNFFQHELAMKFPLIFFPQYLALHNLFVTFKIIFQIIAHAKTRMSNVETAFAFPKPKNVTDIMIVATKRMKTNVKALLVICLNLDVPTAKNV